MSDLYDRLYDQVEQLRESGHEPDRIVVSGDDWDAIEQQSMVVDDEDVFGGEKTLLNGVRVLWNNPQPQAEIMFHVETE